MRTIKEILHVIEEESGEKLFLERFLKSYSPESKELKFIQLLKEGQVQTEAQMARLVYGKNPETSKYRQLKYRLKKKLLNKIFFFEFDDKNDPPKYRVQQKCLSHIHYAHTLYNKRYYELAEYTAKQALKISRRASFTNFQIEALEVLKNIYISVGQKKTFQKTQRELDHAYKILFIEKDAGEIYAQCKMELKGFANKREKMVDDVLSVANKLKTYWEASESTKVYTQYYNLKLIYLELVGRYKKLNELISHTYTLYRTKKINTIHFDINYNKFMEVNSLFRQKAFKEALYLAKHYLKDFRRSTTHWFLYMENYYLLTMHTRKYDQAYDLVTKVWLNKHIKKINTKARERWELYTAYLNLMHSQRKLSKHFDEEKFLKVVPIYQKDKLGFNVSILVLQFMHQLEQADKSGLQDGFATLKDYAQRHLKGPFSKRSRYFLRMLQKVVIFRYDAKLVENVSKDLYESLSNTPEPGDAYAEAEIVPYEQLWEHCLLLLKEKRSKLTFHV